MPVKDFFKWLWGDIGIRFHLEYHRGILTYFVIQLECLINDEWRGIIRYDNSHGFCHKDTIYPDGSQSKEDLSHLTIKQVVQMARLDIESRWEFYVQRYSYRKYSKHEKLLDIHVKKCYNLTKDKV